MRGRASASILLPEGYLPACSSVEGWGASFPFHSHPRHTREGAGNFSYSHARSLAHSRSHQQVSSSCCPGKVQGQLSWVLQLVRGGAGSPSLMTSGPAFPSATGSEGRGRRRSSLLLPLYHMADEGWGHISHVHPWHQITCARPWHQLYGAARERSWAHSPEGLDQLFHYPTCSRRQGARGKGVSLPYPHHCMTHHEYLSHTQEMIFCPKSCIYQIIEYVNQLLNSFKFILFIVYSLYNIMGFIMTLFYM